MMRFQPDETGWVRAAIYQDHPPQEATPSEIQWMEPLTVDPRLIYCDGRTLCTPHDAPTAAARYRQLGLSDTEAATLAAQHDPDGLPDLPPVMSESLRAN